MSQKKVTLFTSIKPTATRCARFVAPSLLIVLLSAFLSESGYRTYLYWLTKKQIENSFNVSVPNYVEAYGAEPPWIFDRQQGFVFNQKPWLYAEIQDGSFNKCHVRGQANQYGNLGKIYFPLEESDLKILIVGSSYSMVADNNENFVSDILAQQLSNKLGKRVTVLNFSRDSTGVLAYIDIVAAKIPELKPDLVLMLVNMTGLIYDRQWRKVVSVGEGMHQLYLMKTSDVDLTDTRLAFPQTILLDDAVTDEWCARMQTAKSNGDETTLKNDQLVKKILTQQSRRLMEVTIPKIQVNTFIKADASFIFNLLKFGDPFYNLEKLKANTSFQPITLNKYSDDDGFVKAVLKIKESGIPFLPIHVPALSEMRSSDPDNFGFSAAGIPVAQGESLSTDLQKQLGQKWIHLFRYYPSVSKSEPLGLVISENDSHPSPLGVHTMASALENVITTHPSTAYFFNSTKSK